MSTEVTCRGCKIRVSRNAQSCYACRCPFPTCHLPEVPERSVVSFPWRWAVPAGVGTLVVVGAVVGALVAVEQWHGGAAHKVPSIRANIGNAR